MEQNETFHFPIGKQKGISNTVTILAQGTHCRPFSEAFLKSYCGFCTTGNRCANYFWMPHWFCFFYNCCKYLCGLRVIFAHRWKSLLPPFLFSQEGSLKVPKGERSCDRMGRSRNMGGGIVCFAKSRYQSLSHGKCPMTKNWKSLFMNSQIVNATVRLLLSTFDQKCIVSLDRKSRLDLFSGCRRQMPGSRAKLNREFALKLLQTARFEQFVAFFGTREIASFSIRSRKHGFNRTSRLESMSPQCMGRGMQGTPQLSLSKLNFGNLIWRELLGSCNHTTLAWMPQHHTAVSLSLSLSGRHRFPADRRSALLSTAGCSIANSNPCIVKNTFGRRIFEPMQTPPNWTTRRRQTCFQFLNDGMFIGCLV